MFHFIFPKFIFKIEKWKWNKEYGIYVSNMGNFLDKDKSPIPVLVSHDSYLHIKTAYGYASAHRVVLKTFKPTKDMDNLTVDHIDHNKRHNEVSNLEWVTEKENLARAERDFLQLNKIDDNKSIFITVSHKTNTAFRVRKFYNYDAVIDWFIQKKKIQNPNRNEIFKKITKAINNGSYYGNYKICGSSVDMT